MMLYMLRVNAAVLVILYRSRSVTVVLPLRTPVCTITPTLRRTGGPAKQLHFILVRAHDTIGQYVLGVLVCSCTLVAQIYYRNCNTFRC